MNFDLGPESEAFRTEVAAFLDEHVTSDVRERVRRTGSMHDWELHRALASRGWLAAGWPEEYGGQGRSPLELMAMREELKKRHAPTEGMGMTMLVARTVLEHGTERMRAGIVPRAINGEILICLGYTEPQGGSDVASARTRAEQDGDEWVINGQKVFTTLAEEAAYVFLLTRTSTGSAGPDEGDPPPRQGKHRGLTMFLVPMDAPGIEIHPIRTIGGERTNTVYYTDVRVPDDARVGAVNGGWDVLLRALTYERSGIGEDSRLLSAIVEAAGDPGAAHSASSGDPTVRERLARLAIDVEVAKLLGRRSCWVESTGGTPTVEGSMHKLFSAESRVRFSSVLLDLLGPQGLREVGDPKAVAGGAFAEEFRHAVILPIWGGSSEVQRRIIAERGLGLPRST
ncbi:acyl-CoA dehydrogenase family protein [Actinomadura sp. 7K507]|uniref:acyl-CoA dehydrogenase family protein n=1 Tax=Actinomadura sp. 7K507 TaxID=2530365 RepID=UPI001051B2F2|nr:acyl-CoA dehydrogenase family protein [Actinomadura sp. 7K507]TDC74906.1 acyl-CoA dehydrogenase [Actinomadura sp. 7K507]